MTSSLVEIRAVVRRQMVDRVVAALKAEGVPRMTVTKIHAVGAGVGRGDAHVSAVEGAEVSDKGMVQCICAADRCDQLVRVIVDAAHTGERGDGIVSVHPVVDVVKVRTGATGLAALG